MVNEYKYEWKEFPIDLPSLLVDLHAAYPSICGISADVNMRVCSTEELDQVALGSIQAHIDALDPAVEAEKRAKPILRESAIDAAKLDAVTKTYDQLSVAQKKLLLGLLPTDSELGI